MPLFSIIIPVYNVEDYLHKCVNSVIDQGFKDIEVILVDDGSPDNCLQLFDELTLMDLHIKIYSVIIYLCIFNKRYYLL
jgi:glycosyltransferase involved in cell wall biosynthesis